MSTRRLVRTAGLFLVALASYQTRTLAADSHKILLEAKAFELRGPTENLEEQKLNF